jgi:(p)ppGpp synthase/HD superfamily hydrolase
MDIAYKAMVFARDVHKEQRRKYTHNPYFEHLAEVVGISLSVFNPDFGITIDEWQAIGWLHDCMEDCGIHFRELEEKFSYLIARAVELLSDLAEGNRETRKKISRERLSGCDAYVQTIKVADLISNTGSIVYHDPKFAKVYLEEKRLLLDVLTKADKRLIEIARSQL